MKMTKIYSLTQPNKKQGERNKIAKQTKRKRTTCAKELETRRKRSFLIASEHALKTPNHGGAKNSQGMQNLSRESDASNM